MLKYHNWKLQQCFPWVCLILSKYHCYISNEYSIVGSGFTGVSLENFSSICTAALFKFHWSSTGVPLENLSARARGMSRLPNSWMRQCLEGKLDGELLLVADPSQQGVPFCTMCQSKTFPSDFLLCLCVNLLFQQKHRKSCEKLP